MGTQTERGYAPEIERIFAEKQGSGLLSALKSRFCGKPTYDTDPLPNVNHQSVGDITNRLRRFHRAHLSAQPGELS